MTKKLKCWEIAGLFLTIGLGVLLHFVYDLSGQNYVVGLFCPVSESTWEHLKMLFFPYVLYAVIEYFGIGRDFCSFWFSKCVGVVAGLLLIPLCFYGYLALTGDHLLALDIAIYVVAVILAYFLSYQIMKHTRKSFYLISILTLFTIGILFIVFTYHVPGCFLFR